MEKGNDSSEKVSRCALYVRVSTKQQLGPDYNSMDAQKDRLKSYVKSQENYVIYKIYEDAGYSAKSLDRPALQTMFQDIRDKKVDCVLAYKMDRLTRNMKDFFTLMEIFEQSDVTFISTTQHFDSNTAHGRLFRSMLMSFAQFEREMTSDRTKDKLEQRAKKGLWNGGRPPFGYNYVTGKGRLLINNAEAETVKFIFESYQQDASIARLRHELKRSGIHTRKGALWGKGQIIHVLRNPVYCGKTKYNDKLYPGQHEPIISVELFNEVQRLVPKRTWSKTKTDLTYMLKGLIKCQDCGSMMSPHYTSKKRKDGKIHRIPYYRCTKTMKHGNVHCSIKSFNANKLERLVTDEIKKISQNRQLIKITVDDLNRSLKEDYLPIRNLIKTLEKRIQEIDKEIDRYVVALGKGKLSIDVLEKKIDSRSQERKDLEDELFKMKNQVDEKSLKEFDAKIVKNTLTSFSDAFDLLSPMDKQEALRILLRDIEVFRDKIVLNVYELPEFSIGSINRTNSVGDTGLEPVTPCL